jgi:hypothetical protein
MVASTVSTKENGGGILQSRNKVVKPEPAFLNLSPHGFYRWAVHFYVCRQTFVSPHTGFSPVPYFLLGRSIELVIKAQHLRSTSQTDVKERFRHNLLSAYEALGPNYKVLSGQELETLKRASKIYNSKRFEYMLMLDVVTGFSKFPDVEELDRISRKLLESAADLELAG